MNIETTLTQHTVTLPEGAQITYFVGGAETAPPVVLLHGGGIDHAMLSWRETIPVLLDAGYRVYAPSYPGYGDSPPDSRPSTMETLLYYLEALMDIWDLKQAVLVGVSMGGGMSIGYTLAHQERVKGIVIIGSYGIQDKAPYHMMSYFMVRMPWFNKAMWNMIRGSRWAASYSVNAIIHNPESRTESLMDEVMEAMQNPNSQEAFGQFQQDEIRWSTMTTNYTDQLSKIDVPVLMVHGTHDIGVPLKYAKRAATRFQNVQLEIIENAGHWTQRDYPERFNTLLLEFLKAQYA